MDGSAAKMRFFGEKRANPAERLEAANKQTGMARTHADYKHSEKTPKIWTFMRKLEDVIALTLCVATTMCLALAGSALPLYAETGLRVREPSHGFSVEIPPILQPFDVSAPTVALAARSAEGYPTFNIIIEPGTLFVRRETLAREAENTLQSYRERGLTDVRLIASEITPLAGRATYRFELEYHFGERLVRAVVIEAPSKNRYLVLTFTDRSEQFSHHEALLSSILASLELTDPPPEDIAPLESPARHHWYWVPVLLGVILVGFILRSRLSRGRN